MAQSQQLADKETDMTGCENEETFDEVAKYVVQLTSVTVQR